MTVKSMAYDHPAYTARLTHQPGPQTAGASKTFDKFLAWTSMIVYAVNVGTVTAGTSTYTAWNGTATVTTTGTGDTVTLFRVFTGGGTATYGPYAVDAAAGGARKYQIGGTATGTASYAGSAGFADGGIALARGDQFYVVRGTDATAVQTVSYEYALLPGADVSN